MTRDEFLRVRAVADWEKTHRVHRCPDGAALTTPATWAIHGAHSGAIAAGEALHIAEKSSRERRVARLVRSLAHMRE
jgi:hypothetical protein